MQTTTVIFMVLILTVLWGGFGWMLVHSMKTDRRRSSEARADGTRDD